ncbi:MAG: extracellular solute-binding protein [Candidatus Abyssobacteria bacterium SURF_5]|uniref:Extracellular solute-binding protein n=1 Tax=Abyssobacteria bacterium (strain SURF_5) TaxID=2093360 RepID=A0A3A4N481_ABYX5|nr:MAG: extracellular solute-binding protein [Candidatus Abyssubacteria bacterium SURF_5]
MAAFASGTAVLKFTRLAFGALAAAVFACAFVHADGAPSEERLLLWHQETGQRRKILQSIIKEINCRDQTARVEDVVFGPARGAVAEKLRSIKPEERPHLALVEREALPALADKGIIFPVDRFLENHGILKNKVLVPPAREYVRYRDLLYGIPASLNPYVFICNPALLAEIGAELPSDWDDILQLQKHVAKHRPAGAEEIWTLNTRSLDSIFSILAVQKGLSGAEKQDEVLADILELLHKFRKQNVFPPYYKFWDPNFLEVTDRKVLFQIEDANLVSAMQDSTEIPLVIAPMPSVSENRVTALSDSLVFVLCRTDNLQAASAFLELFFNPSYYRMFQEKCFYVNPFTSTAGGMEIEEDDPLYRQVLVSARAGKPLDLSLGGGAFSKISRAVAQLDAGLLSPEEALREITRSFDAENHGKGAASDAISVSWAESTRRIFAGERRGLKNLPVTVTCARNENESFQLLISSEKEAERVTWKVESPPRNEDASHFRIEVYGERDTTVPLPLVANEAGAYPNILEPVDSFDLSPGAPVRLWVEIFVGRGVPAGERTLAIILENPEKAWCRIPIKIQVLPWEIPASPSQPAVVGLNYDLVARHLGVDKNSADGREVLDSFYWFLVERRLTPYQPPVSLNSDRIGEYLRDERVSACRFPLPPVNEWYAPLVELGEKEGWLDKIFVYFIDEPTYHQYSAVVETGREIHSRGKRPKFLVTCMPDEMLVGSVDIWGIHISFLPVGIPHLFSDRSEYLARVNGRLPQEAVWWYTAGPVKPFPTLHIEDDPSAFRVIPWMQQLYGIDGFLHWEAANWTQPFDEAFIPLFGNGEGVLIYSQGGRPAPSIRLELLREGLEDMEYLFLLRRNIETVQKILSAEYLGDVATIRIGELCRRLVSRDSLHTDPAGILPLMSFAREPGKIEQARSEVITEIASMIDRPYALVLTDPEERRYTDAATVRIYGVTEPDCAIEINSHSLSAASSGAFSMNLPLEEGVNSFSIVFKNGAMTKNIIRVIEKD